MSASQHKLLIFCEWYPSYVCVAYLLNILSILEDEICIHAWIILFRNKIDHCIVCQLTLVTCCLPSELISWDRFFQDPFTKQSVDSTSLIYFMILNWQLMKGVFYKPSYDEKFRALSCKDIA